ncbi:hypothetical protein NC651_003187 [Populus alba x Populus x berolinensis]|nr:hypothetical protein NC651_003187 [Populus alba x Populus x berolinensis]
MASKLHAVTLAAALMNEPGLTIRGCKEGLSLASKCIRNPKNLMDAGGKTELEAAEKAFVGFFSFFLNYPRDVCAVFSQKTGGVLP